MYAAMKKSMNSIVFLIFSVHAVALVSGNKCPPAESIMPCRCRGRNDQVQVWCSHSDLERVNGALENLMRLRNMPAIDELIVENNRMPTLPARAFGALQIGRLLLRNNGLEGFSRNAFAGLEDSLEELYIVEEKLIDFPFDAIEKLRNLEAFTLEHSRVRLLPRFNGLNRLKHIRIDGSLISGFPVGAFANMASVKQIHVVNSQVTTLAEGIFGKLENLVLANFSLNKIDHVQKKVFALLPRLEILSLSNNLLEETIPVGRAVEELISLKSLDLSFNRFRQLPEGSFVNLRTLQSLNLAGNSISRVSMRAFTHLPALRKADLSYNELRNFPKMLFDTTPLLEEIRLRGNSIGTAKEIGEMLETMKSLRYLDLAANGLSELPTGAIKGHTHLMKLDLSDNKITRIEREAFKECPSLTEISLRNNSLVELPLDGLAWDIASLKELDLSTNKLTSMTQSALQGLPNLARMDLKFNGIKSLGQGVFSKNKELDLLDISDNGITVISSEAFNGLSKLTKLDLSRNHLESIPPGAFRDLKSLSYLRMDNNRINNMAPNMVHELRSLEELSVKGNKLSHIPPGFFNTLQNLKTLNLRDNSISSIQNKMFSNLQNLETLKLASNQISHFDDSAFDLLQLKSLDLSGNKITRLPSRSFKNLPALERFEARENKISVVEPGVLASSSQLQILDLAHNALIQVPEIVKTNSFLKVVDLSFNQISDIPVDTFQKADNLMEIYLNQNKIKRLHSKTFENLGSLTILDMDGNEVEEIQTGTFRNLPRLIYLRLSRNNLRNIHPFAFSGLNALDGLDLQENELEVVADNAFEKTGALKYLNISGNNFDSMAKMGLGPLSSLEVLDMSFNRLSGVDAKALRHLIWLVELRMNDNGICLIPPGTFDAMSRLKMLVLKNNSLAHLYESVFYKLRNNIAFIDVSGNPLSCDCEMIWLRNLMAREAIQELSDSICDGPNELQGVPLKAARPGRMICNPGVSSRGLSNSISDVKCPPMTKSRRKPRPNIVELDDNPLYLNNAYPEASQNELRHNSRRKSDKLIESNDYVPGDTPTIYAGSSTSNTNTKATQDDLRKSNSVFGGLSSLFGIPLDFGLNLGISPSVSVTDKSTSRHSHVGKNGFSIDGNRKGSDPLPASWIDRPTKPIYEPPIYHPSKPAQPYIPLNPYREQNSPPVVPSGSVDVHKSIDPNGIDEKENRRKKPIIKFPTGAPPPPPASWHPSYPDTETGFIPIEPFFHSNSFFRNNKNAFQQNQKQHHNKTESKKTKADGESSGSNVQYFSSTTQPPLSRTHGNAKFIHQHNANTVNLNTTTTTSSTTSTSSISTSTTSSNSAKKTGAEAGKRPFKTFNSPTDSRRDNNVGKLDQPGLSSISSSSTSSSSTQSESEEYNEDEINNYTPVDTQSPDDQPRNSEEKDKGQSELSLSDFFDIFTGKPIKNVHISNPDPPKQPDPTTQYYDDQIDFANPIDATPIPADHYPNVEVKGGVDHNGKPHKGKVTKIIEQEFHPSSVQNSTSSTGSSSSSSSYANPPDNPISNELDGPRPDNDDPVIPSHGPLSPQPLIPPVVIGSKTHDADWYYQNYHGESAMQSQEWEKLIEKNRIKSLEEELVGAKRSSSSSSSNSKYFNASYHFCLANLLYYLLVYMNP